MTTKNKAQIIKIIEDNKDKFKDFGVTRIGLFGSFGRGEQTEKSDIDLLVDFEKGKKTYKNYIDLYDYSENLLGRKIDLMTQKSLSPHLAPHINKEIEYVQISD